MTNRQSSVGIDSDGHKTVVPYTLEKVRVRAVARRRTNRRQTAKWIGNRSRRQKMRTVAVCVGTLLLMALGLYFGLLHQEATGPVESAASIRAGRRLASRLG
jgi:transcriptional regulator GlxA family with amidase domain